MFAILIVSHALYVGMTEASQEETKQINIRVTEKFLEKIDDTWQGRGYNSRSEYIRHVLHDAVENPTFDRDELVALARTEHELREEDDG